MLQFTAIGWAIRTGQLTAAAQKAAPSAESWDAAVACEVKRGDVPVDLRDEIERTVRLAAKTLGLDPAPRLRWLPAEIRGIRGIVHDENLNDIWVKVQDRAAAKNTCLHELRHVWQLQPDQRRWTRPELLTMEQRQQDADDFAASWDPFAPTAATPAPVGAHAMPNQRSARPSTNPYPLMPARERWEHKGVVYIACDNCDQGVPVNTTHRCRAAYAVTGSRY